MTPDYYELLGVNKSASAEEIRSAYKRLLRQAHPDTGGTSGLFIVIEQAWETLSDPARRASYDRERSRPGQSSSGSGSSDSAPSNHSDDFTRGYAEEAGRSRFREEQAQREREEARQRQYEHDRAAARERARRKKQYASEAARTERLRPYYDAVRKLSEKEKQLHFRGNVRLTYVLALHRAESSQYVVIFVIAALIALNAAFMIMGTATLTGFSYWFALVFNMVVIFLGSGVILVFVSAALLWLAKVAAPRRRNVSDTELQDEYLSAQSNG